jgi:hypothetical protein
MGSTTNKYFKDVETLSFWINKTIPLVYDDSLSLMELVSKVVKKLNELTDNVNQMPKYVGELIEQYIVSGEINVIINNILSNYFLNVKNPPNGEESASGNGSTDDTLAIQACIDYAHSIGGGSVYIPSGVYLTRSLQLKDNVTLFGFDRQNTRLVLMGGSTNHLLYGDANNISITNLQLDGNMDIQVNNLDLINITGRDLYFNDLILTDGYTLINANLQDGYFQANNLIIKRGVIDGIHLKGVGISSITNVIVETLSELSGRYPLNIECDNTTVHNFISKANTNIGVNITSDNCFVSGNVFNSSKSYENTGVNNTIFINNGDSIIEQKTLLINSNNMTANIDVSIENVVTKSFNGDKVTINTKESLGYKTPTKIDEHFHTVPMSTTGGLEYEVLVRGSKDVGFTYLQENEPMEANNESIWYKISTTTGHDFELPEDIIYEPIN